MFVLNVIIVTTSGWENQGDVCMKVTHVRVLKRACPHNESDGMCRIHPDIIDPVEEKSYK
ncbi:hypothetical protein TetV_324 [Tetraselmis virus 1]|uniref:Uncharacterized protein n=1 Tax=Tetraselmis virus 1 TaxID=2060617 RepID=A0A2P0VNC8_9VIRU|nr:hypothetical protein QJ968_gp324 [Tetraselmis virus 1]AUF82416.1 hypothetical protein TetV_324 [Tetraselmis virus 1]